MKTFSLISLAMMFLVAAMVESAPWHKETESVLKLVIKDYEYSPAKAIIDYFKKLCEIGGPLYPCAGMESSDDYGDYQ